MLSLSSSELPRSSGAYIAEALVGRRTEAAGCFCAHAVRHAVFAAG